MITVSGILKTPAGAVLANTEIKFQAVATGSNVLQGTTGIIVTGADGSYSVTLQQGSHRVTVRQGNTRPETIGMVHISADTTASTLNELLLAASAASPGNPLADEVLAARDRAETAASAAEASRAAAQQIKTDTAAIRDQTSQISGLDTVEQAIALAAPDMLAKADPARHPFRGKLPSLALEFARNRYHLVGDYGLEPQQLTDVLTVSNGVSTRVDHRGQIVPTAVDQPVIDYDPATGGCLGLSVQEQRTNLVLWSEDLSNSYWNKNGACTVTPDTPYGAISAFRVENATVFVNSTGNDNLRSSSIPVVEGTTYTVHARIKSLHPDSQARFRVAGSLGDVYSSFANLKVGEYVSISVTVSVNTGVTAFNLIFADQAGYDFGVAGIMVEVGPSPSRYIKTEASAVTRVADNISRALGDEFDKNTWTVFVDFIFKPSSFSGNPHIFALGTSALSGSSPRSSIRLGGANSWDWQVLNDNGEVLINTRGGLPVLSEGKNKLAYTFNHTGDAYLSLNGQAVAISPATFTRIFTNLTTLWPDNSNANKANNNIGALLLFPKSMTQEELQELTKP